MHYNRGDNLNYEELLLEADQHDVRVIEMQLSGYSGLIEDNFIAIRKDMTDTEKACILAEELGHYHTTVGNILDQTSVENVKQERQARIWAYEKQVGLQGLVNCFEERCRNTYEMAEFLEVTEEFLKDALTYYRQKYGVCTQHHYYTIFFEPTLLIHKNSNGEMLSHK